VASNRISSPVFQAHMNRLPRWKAMPVGAMVSLKRHSGAVNPS